MLSDYYRERKGKGDYLVVHTHYCRNRDGSWPCRIFGPDRGLGPVQDGSCTDQFLSTCKPIQRKSVPQKIRQQLDGPDSGLSDSAIQEAAQSLYAVVWANAWEAIGGPFNPGGAIEDVCPPVPSAGVAIVREWVARLDEVSPYPLFDLFTSMEWLDDDEGHGTGLYYLIMGCLGSGVGLGDFDGGSDDRIGPAEKTLGVTIDTSPLNLDDSDLRELADEWVENHPPDPDHPREVPPCKGQTTAS